MFKKKMSLPLVGLLQSLGILVYVLLVAAFMWNMERINYDPIGLLGAALMLFLLVFSAAICGLTVFGYPVYLVLDKKVKEAMMVLGYTFLFSLIFLSLLLTFTFLI